MNDAKSRSIYILYGIAGIGKSMVAKTVAERAACDKVLGASFFFSRDKGNRKSFFPTCYDPKLSGTLWTTLHHQ
jgi:hypothetical protein